jgi:hypothetical protein
VARNVGGSDVAGVDNAGTGGLCLETTGFFGSSAGFFGSSGARAAFGATSARAFAAGTASVFVAGCFAHAAIDSARIASFCAAAFAAEASFASLSCAVTAAT